MVIGISTMWNALKQSDGGALIDELSGLGFDAIELSRHLTREQIEQIRFHSQEIKICSIHNFCPMLPGVPQSRAENDPIHLSSLDADERGEAVRRTIRTMELAVDIEVPIVVLHLGEVDTYDRSYLMYDLYEYGEREFEAFSKKVIEATDWRERKQAEHQDAVLFSLDTLNEKALRMDLYLAIENRPRYYQIPDFDEVGMFLERFEGSNMRYWHDVGHAMLQERIGLCWSNRWLEAYKDHLIGVNLHDLKDLEAYHPPGFGDLDFKEIMAQIPPEVPKVLELRHGRAEELEEARETCQSLVPVETSEAD
ncbi:MAG: TIM barrel protein [Candidatus Poribacteria bacterium]|nr:TIM barrel protein [Candidatus Poribacteria bacterium]